MTSGRVPGAPRDSAPNAAKPVAQHLIRRIVTTRSGGVSQAPYDSFNLGGAVGDDPASVRANRHRLAVAAGLHAQRMVWMQQVHKTRVVPVDQPGPLPATDGVVTSRRELGLAVLVADCVPILAADPVAGVIAAVHAGRPGAAAGIATEMLAVMIDNGAAVENIDVLLGPAICGRCYEVPRAMQRVVERSLPGSECQTSAGTTGLDLRAGLARQLARAGVATIVTDPRCTREDAELFSYRRDSTTGRQAGLIWMPST